MIMLSTPYTLFIQMPHTQSNFVRIQPWEFLFQLSCSERHIFGAQLVLELGIPQQALGTIFAGQHQVAIGG